MRQDVFWIGLAINLALVYTVNGQCIPTSNTNPQITAYVPGNLSVSYTTASAICIHTLSAPTTPTTHKLLIQLVDVDAPCKADGTAGIGTDGDRIGIQQGTSSAGPALIQPGDGCSILGAGMMENKQFGASTGSDLFVTGTNDNTNLAPNGKYTVAYIAGKDDSGTCNTGHPLTGTTSPEILTSPLFPAAATVVRDCIYTITADDITRVVQIETLVINLKDPTSGTCAVDEYVQLLEGDATSTQEIIKLCGSSWAQTMYKSLGSKLTIKVKIAVTPGKYGFAFKFSTAAAAPNNNGVGSSVTFGILGPLYCLIGGFIVTQRYQL